jgi:three-Cys-motif partner protein
MPKQYESNRDWLEKHLRVLMEIGRKVRQFDTQLQASKPLYTYNKGYWTGLKLICLYYYLPTYIRILGKYQIAYVDLFCGPGLNLIGDREVPVPGSAIIPIEHHGTKKGFDFHLYGDTNTEYINALKRRLECFASIDSCSFRMEMADACQEDANTLARRAPDILSEKDIDHCLVFVDPEGLQLKWSSLEYFVSNFPNSDWIILFPSAGFSRLLGRKDEAAWNTIRDFIGPGSESLGQHSSEEDAIALYRNNLADLGKDISTQIAITGSGSFHYHLIPAVRKTQAGSPWFESFREAKRRIKSLDSEILNIIAQQIDGLQGTL